MSFGGAKISSIHSSLSPAVFTPARFDAVMNDLARACVARIRGASGEIWLSTRVLAPSGETHCVPLVDLGLDPSAQPVGFNRVELGGEERSVLQRMFTADKGLWSEGDWVSYEAFFEDGSSDLVVILPREGDGAAMGRRQTRSLWLLLRETCLLEVAATERDQSTLDTALLRLLSDRIGMAVLVLDRQCRVLRANAAGKAMLESGDVLAPTGKGVGCRSRKCAAELHSAVRECLEEGNDDENERVIILEGEDGKGSIPMFLRRFDGGPGAQMVIAMLPLPPDEDRIECLALKMGLTRSEARIATLMRRGLSNKEMAEAASLTEQTCSTYSKRVLSKLKVARRAEIAQLLTWQAV